MKVPTKYLSLYLFIYLISISFISCVIEVPLYPLKVKRNPKYSNISTVMEKYNLPEDNIELSFSEEGSIFMNGDILFIARIKLGSGKKEFRLLLDTGSSLLWVAKNGCTGDNSIENKFNPDESTTSVNTGQYFEIQYGTGACKGYYYGDNIEYIGNKQFKLYFGVVNHADFQADQCDGIIGLSKSYEDERLSFIHMLKEYDVTDSLAFSVKFEGVKMADNIAGVLYIGEHEDFSKDEAVSVPLTFYRNKIFWSATLYSFGLKTQTSETISNREINILFDTGSNNIILPVEYLIDIQDSLKLYNCSIIKSDSYYQLISNIYSSPPDFVFKIGPHNLTIPWNYGFHRRNSYYLYSFVLFQQTSTYIMGSPFFFVFHTLFDGKNDQLKFYPLKTSTIDKGSTGLSTFVIVLIVIAVIAFIVALALITYYFVIKCKEKKNKDIPTENLGVNYFEGLYKK